MLACHFHLLLVHQGRTLHAIRSVDNQGSFVTLSHSFNPSISGSSYVRHSSSSEVSGSRLVCLGTQAAKAGSEAISFSKYLSRSSHVPSTMLAPGVPGWTSLSGPARHCPSRSYFPDVFNTCHLCIPCNTLVIHQVLA